MVDFVEKEGVDKIEGPELRRLLRSCELAVANLQGLGAEALDLLRTLDTIADALESRRERGIDVRSEEVRLEAILNILRRKTILLLKELRAVGGLGNVREREDPRPLEGHWWWYLDLEHRRRQQARFQHYLRVIAVGVALLTLTVLAYSRLVPHDPILEAKMDHTSLAERYIEDGEISAAVSEFEAARALDPSDPNILIWLGVVYERQERSREAGEVFAEAIGLVENRAQFLVMRGFIYSQLGDIVKALADGQDAVVLDPDLATAHLVVAGAYETNGDVQQALQELEITAQLAQADGNDTLYVIAKSRQAMLMQSGIGGFGSP